MPLELGYKLVQIHADAREALRELAYRRRKPMYIVLQDVVYEALAREKELQAVPFRDHDMEGVPF